MDNPRPILEHLGLAAPRLLGTGIGSQVYEYTGDTVVKIHGGADLASLERLRAFYERLSAYRFPFALPSILGIDCVDGTFFTIERRLPGEMLSRTLPLLAARQRRLLLERYLLAVDDIGQVTFPERPFGHLLADQPVHAPTWRGFLEKMIEQGLRRAVGYLNEDVGDVQRIERFLEQEIALVADVQTKSLVHGDYWPDNVLVDVADGVNGRQDVSAVLDFDGMTLVGDRRLDVAGAVVFLEMRQGYPRRDSDILLRRAMMQHGLAIAQIIYFYRMWYSAVYAHCKPFDRLTYFWCVTNFQRHLSARAGRGAPAGVPPAGVPPAGVPSP